MSTLSDRYVWGVMCSIPDRQRADLEPEIRALVADAVEAAEARAVPGAPVDHAAAERAALTGLGDPELLAARYLDRGLYLIGPLYFLDYKRLLTLLLTIVVPIVTLATMAASFLVTQEAVLTAVLSGLSAGFMVALQLGFWVTVGFAAVERYGKGTSGPLMEWSLDRLPDTPSPARLSAGDAIASIVGNVLLLGVIAWGPPFIASAGDATTVPFFDPALAATWAPWFVAIAVAQIAFAVVVYAARRWNWSIAIINAGLDVAFAIPAVWLLQTGQLLSQDAVAEMERIGAGAALAPTMAVMAVVIIGLVAWDALDGFLKAGRSSGNNRAISGRVSRT